jgi:hypothetical protein
MTTIYHPNIIKFINIRDGDSYSKKKVILSFRAAPAFRLSGAKLKKNNLGG